MCAFSLHRVVSNAIWKGLGKCRNHALSFVFGLGADVRIFPPCPSTKGVCRAPQASCTTTIGIGHCHRHATRPMVTQPDAVRTTQQLSRSALRLFGAEPCMWVGTRQRYHGTHQPPQHGVNASPSSTLHKGPISHPHTKKQQSQDRSSRSQ